MQPQSDLIIDRKRLKSQLNGWRLLALLALLLAGFVALKQSSLSGLRNVGSMHQDYVARLTIEGVMSDDPKRDELMTELRDNPHVKAVLVRMDSPGGTTVGGEEIFLQLREIAKRKPVVGVMRTVCASACYMASLAADQVFARSGTLTGSIGVLLQSVEVSELMGKLGVKSVTIKSGPYKDVPDLAEPFTPQQREVVSELVTDAFNHFVAMIVQRRDLNEDEVRTLADGRVYTGSQAVKLKLIDGLGGEDEARAWLEKNRKISRDLEIEDVKPAQELDSLLDRLAQVSGINFLSKSPLALDGLVSIWHPALIR